jgi:predicted GH43/DUF377 family glycosyl hydrolase
LRYSAGALVLKRDRPEEILYRSRRPVLAPRSGDESIGLVPNVVFPTGIDRRDDLGLPDRFDVYYGVADDRIAVATLTVPRRLPDASCNAAAVRDEFEPEGLQPVETAA